MRRLEDFAVASMAGPIAELRFTGSLGDGNQSDIDFLGDVIARLSGGDPVAIDEISDRLHDRAEAMVDEQWSFIEAVARRLLSDGRVEGRDLRAIRDSATS